MTAEAGSQIMWQLFITNLRADLPSPWLQIVLALASVVCGAIVGAEREKREKPAGLRTLVLVCLGSTGFTMASYAFTTTTGDSGRVAAQIVTGIGFLGAGAILHGSGLVKGMTTAATIWVTAATGMIVGIGYAGAGLAMSLLTRGVLTGIFVLESRYLGGMDTSQVELVFKSDRGKTRVHLEKIMEDFHVGGFQVVGMPDPNGLVRATIRFRLQRHQRCEFLHELAVLPEVIEINEKQIDPGGGQSS
jgi:putative Mg2+ transporter-C (MgtC) family protein